MGVTRTYELIGEYIFNEPFVFRTKNKLGEDITLGRKPWCQDFKSRRGELIPDGKWMVCPKCKQPDKDKLTECPNCNRLWRGPRPDFPFQLECYECDN